jgi:hypothetical protein
MVDFKNRNYGGFIMKLKLDSLSEWLVGNMNKQILIQKKEQGDLDEVQIQLKNIEHRGERNNAIDDYTSDSALLLHGDGSVITNGLEVDLPANIFEIPLSGLKQVKVHQDSLSFKTERAHYMLILQ